MDLAPIYLPLLTQEAGNGFNDLQFRLQSHPLANIFAKFKSESPKMPEAVYNQPGVRSVWKIVNGLVDFSQQRCPKCERTKEETHFCNSEVFEEYLFKIGSFRC